MSWKEEFKVYLAKYCNKHKIAPEKACWHAIVKNVAKNYIAIEKEEKKSGKQ